MSKYKRPFSVDYRKPVVIDSSDPRAQNLEKYRSNLGRDLLVNEIPKVQELDNYKEYWSQTLENITNADTNYKPITVKSFFSNTLATSNESSSSEEYFYILEEAENGEDDFNSLKVTKYNAKGDIFWNKKIKASSPDRITAHDYSVLTEVNYLTQNMVIDNEQNIYICAGISTGTLFNFVKGYIAKLSGSGEVLWEKSGEIPNNNIVNYSDPVFSHIALDSDKNIYAIYTFDRAINLIKYDTDGNVIWSKKYKTDYPSENYFISGLFSQILVDNDDNIYVSSPYKVFDGEFDVCVLIKIDSDGLIEWKKLIDLDGYSFKTTVMQYDFKQNNIILGFDSGSNYKGFIRIDKECNLIESKMIGAYYSIGNWDGRNINIFQNQGVFIDNYSGGIFYVPEDDNTSLLGGSLGSNGVVVSIDNNFISNWSKQIFGENISGMPNITDLSFSRNPGSPIDQLYLLPLKEGLVIFESYYLTYIPKNGSRIGTTVSKNEFSDPDVVPTVIIEDEELIFVENITDFVSDDYETEHSSSSFIPVAVRF